MDTTKKKVQVNVDRATEAQAKIIFDSLGFSTSAVINAMMKRVVAEGKIPFSLQLTERELSDARLSAAVAQSKAKVITDPKAIQAYLFGEADDEY